MATAEPLEQMLYRYFRMRRFRTGQKEIIKDVLIGNDVLGVLPTGSGKSICYQLPAMLLDGITIVVSPLIALMVDQVKQLRANGLKQVAAVNSFLHPSERQRIMKHINHYKLLYVSPETLMKTSFLERILNFPISLFVIDEAHCISQWGYEFRPDYMRLGEIVEKLGSPPVMALSATATKEVQNDIMKVLKKPQINKHIYPIDKENLIFMVEHMDQEQQKIDYILAWLKKCPGPILIYFSSRQMAESVADRISKLSNNRIAAYHGGLEQMDRLFIQQQFMLGQLDVICCTSAFGMGIDKSDIRMVIHYHMPSDVKSYIQEAGRAGRDMQTSLCVLLYAKHDEMLPKQLADMEIPNEDLIRQSIQLLIYWKQQGNDFNKDTFIRLLGLYESQWHFLQYQFEKHHILLDNKIYKVNGLKIEEEIIAYAYLRKQKKEKRIYEMIAYIMNENCRRKSLYYHFQSGFTKPDICCDQCGISIDAIRFPVKPSAHFIEKPWKMKLQDILLVGRPDE